MEAIIRHNGKDWVVENERFVLSAPTLEQLDALVKEEILNKGLVEKGEKIEVFMMFDNGTIPQWIRQYSQHYFNRILVVEAE